MQKQHNDCRAQFCRVNYDKSILHYIKRFEQYV